MENFSWYWDSSVDLKSELPNIMITSDTYRNNIEKRFFPTLISHILLEFWCDFSHLCYKVILIIIRHREGALEKPLAHMEKKKRFLKACIKYYSVIFVSSFICVLIQLWWYLTINTAAECNALRKSPRCMRFNFHLLLLFWI